MGALLEGKERAETGIPKSEELGEWEVCNITYFTK